MKGLGPHTSGNKQPQQTWRNRQRTCLNYKPELMGKIQRQALGSMRQHMYTYHRLRRTLSHTFKDTENYKGHLVSYLLPTCFLLSLSGFPLLHKISLCAFPTSFPNRSLYYSRNCQGKQTTKMASLPHLRGHRDGSHEGLVCACLPGEFLDIPCPGMGVAGGGHEGGVTKGERKLFFSQFGHVLKS